MIKIYGKDNCAYCNMAKQLCESKGLEFEYLSLGLDYLRDEFFEMFPTARTFPQITMDGEAIGGFTELRDKV
jgi:glutaredoxin 3